MGNLWTPWRLAYITAAKAAEGCIFCSAWWSQDDSDSQVVHRGSDALVMLNRYPYSNGHLLVSPRAHVASLTELEADARAELLELAARGESVLRGLYRPDGLNLGMNLGQAAGAGVVGHLHLHIVPRWHGDTNYMSVVNDVRIIPERLEDTFRRVREGFASA